MVTKFIILSAVLVFMNFSNVHGSIRFRRSAERELQTSSMDIIHDGNVESRIWKRAVPRNIKKTTKSNEAIPELDNHSTPLFHTQPDAPVNSDELSESDTGSPTSEEKIPRKTVPTLTKTPPRIKGANPDKKSPRNTKSRSYSRTTPKSVSSTSPNSEENEDLTDTTTSRPNKKSQIPSKSPKNPQNTKDDAEDTEVKEPEENTEDEKIPEEITEDDKEPEENTEDEKEPDENTKDEEEPEEITEDEKESEKNTEDEKEPDDNTKEEKELEENTEDENEPDELEKEEPEPEEPTDDEKEPKELDRNPKKEKQFERPQFKGSQRSSPTPKPSRPASTRPTKPPPPFPGKQSSASAKRPQAESPITYIRPFKAATTIRRSTTESPESSNGESINEDDIVNENPITTTPASKQRPRTKNRSKVPVRPRVNSPSSRTPNRENKSVEPSAPVETDPSLPENDPYSNNDDTDFEGNPVSEETLHENPDESSNKNLTTSTARPRTKVNTRPKTSTKQRPTKRPNTRKNPISNPAENEDPYTTPASDENPDLPSRFADNEPDTDQSQNNPDDKTKFSKRPQYPNSSSPPAGPYMANPFLTPPFGMSVANSFSSAGSGASASASASANSNTGTPDWAPWPNFFMNRFGDPSAVSPPMFSGNPFFNTPNNPKNQQTSELPFPSYPSNNEDHFPKNRPIRGDDQSPSSSKPEPKGYTPIISISGTFDVNDPPTQSRSSFPSSDSTPSRSTDNHDFDSQINMNAPSHGPMGGASFTPIFDQISDSINSDSNNGYPSGGGEFASANSFSSGGPGGSILSSSSTNSDGRNSGNNDIGGFPGNEAQYWASPFWGPSSFDIFRQNQAMQNQIWKQIQDSQRQTEEQINRAQQQSSLTARGSASMNDPYGYTNPNAQIYSRTQAYQPQPLGGYGETESSQYQPYDTLLQQNYPTSFTFSNQRYGTTGTSGTGGTSGGSAFAFGSASAGSRGSNQAGAIGPVGPDIQSRFAENYPPSGGNSYGSFSSSKTSSVIGPDGKPITRKVVTTGVNDNGKVSIKTIHD